MYIFQILICLILVACGENRDSSPKEYPFGNTTNQQMTKLESTKSLIHHIQEDNKDFILFVMGSLKELVPVNIKDDDLILVGVKETDTQGEETRIYFDCVINGKLKVRWEMHLTSSSPDAFDYVRVLAYQDGHHFVRKLSPDKIYQ